MAVAARVRVGRVGSGHQQVGAFGEAEDAEHRGALVDVDQALGGQPVGVEEVLLLDEAADAGLCEFGVQLDVVGEVMKIVRTASSIRSSGVISGSTLRMM